jgi:creatinine amidohydrolase
MSKAATEYRYNRLTWPEMNDAIAAQKLIILPTGSTEQHGHHLPLATDSLLAADLARDVAADAEQDLLVAPCITYGFRSRPLSGGGPGFVGTTSASAATLMGLVQDVLESLLEQGFRRLALVNWHYENQNFIYESAHLALRRLPAAAEAGAKVVIAEMAFQELSEEVMQLLFPDGFPGWDVEHAAIMETSLMLHLHPELVLSERAVDDEAERHPFYDVLPVPDAFVPKSGSLWKARQGSAEKGAACWPEVVDQMRRALALELPR